MRILTNISELQPETCSEEELQEEIVSQLRELYNECADDDEANLRDEADEVILGRDKPDALVREAEQWNDRLRSDFDFALAQMKRQKRKNGCWPVDDQTTYALKKAALAIDDDFYSFSDYAVTRPLTGSPGYLEVVIRPEELEFTRQHPEQFAIVDIAAK